MKKIICLILGLSFLLVGCPSANDNAADYNEPDEQVQNTQEVTTKENTEDNKMSENNTIAVVIARDRYQSLEYNPVVDALNGANYKIIVASDALGTATGTQENTKVDIAFSDINPSELTGIVLIGGSKSLWDNEELHAILNEMNNEKKLVAAICYGSVTLAKAHVIGDGDTACWYNSEESDPVMQSEGVIDSNKDVTINENIITGDGPDSAEEFAAEVVNLLNSQK